MSEEHETIVRRSYKEVWSEGRLDVVDELYGADFVLYDPAQPGIRGPEEYKQLVANNRAAFPDAQFTIEDQLAEGDQVVTRWRAEGTHQGEFVDIPPTGKQVTITGITISRIAGGKIVQEISNWDALGLVRHLEAASEVGAIGE